MKAQGVQSQKIQQQQNRTVLKQTKLIQQTTQNTHQMIRSTLPEQQGNLLKTSLQINDNSTNNNYQSCTSRLMLRSTPAHTTKGLSTPANKTP